MKKILLIGDSVRIGYDRYVKESFANLAEVYYPGENCRYTTYILRDLHNWTDRLGLYDADLVHWNAGLWDTLRIYGDGPLTSPAVYADNLTRIAARIERLFPGAKQIFATSTPVIERGYIDGFEMRYNADIEEYNEIAKKVLAPRGVGINDLYALLSDKPEDYHSDQTHFYTAKATELIGGQVNSVLACALGIDPGKLTPPPSENFVRDDVPGDLDVYEKRGHIWTVKRK